jgi:hypothetical protein
MKALFITAKATDCYGLVRAWESAFAPAEHFVFNAKTLRNDWMFPKVVEELRPDIVLYNGPVGGVGAPQVESLRQVRELAPFVHLCSDATDTPWHPVLQQYANAHCFDVQVSLDGAGPPAPIDLPMITPVDPTPFAQRGIRDIKVGMSGARGDRLRAETVNFLEDEGLLTVRQRVFDNDSYEDHGRFTARCRILLNGAQTGSGSDRFHIKGRVLEAGWAGCALLENSASPIGSWFPPNCYLSYDSPQHAADIIRHTPFEEIEARASNLAAAVRELYTAEKIYSTIISETFLRRMTV